MLNFVSREENGCNDMKFCCCQCHTEVQLEPQEPSKPEQMEYGNCICANLACETICRCNKR